MSGEAGVDFFFFLGHIARRVYFLGGIARWVYFEATGDTFCVVAGVAAIPALVWYFYLPNHARTVVRATPRLVATDSCE